MVKMRDRDVQDLEIGMYKKRGNHELHRKKCGIKIAKNRTIKTSRKQSKCGNGVRDFKAWDSNYLMKTTEIQMS